MPQITPDDIDAVILKFNTQNYTPEAKQITREISATVNQSKQVEELLFGIIRKGLEQNLLGYDDKTVVIISMTSFVAGIMIGRELCQKTN